MIQCMFIRPKQNLRCPEKDEIQIILSPTESRQFLKSVSEIPITKRGKLLDDIRVKLLVFLRIHL